MAKKGIQYVVVDAFTAQPFKGNPAAVCFLEDDAAAPAGDGRWMQSVAVEFNLSQTAFFSRDSSCAADAATPRFHLRWFTPVVSVHKSVTTNDFIVELSSGKEVADVLPNIEEIRKCAGRGVIVTAPAPAGSGYDFFTRFFCPKFGIDEDPVCGSAHCVLAPYWGGKLGKQKLIAFQVSPRSGTLYLELDVVNRRVRIQGEAVTVMAGTLFA
ncbi:unnamed protein product [Triticum turgidum subsp. durum]|uniref:Uncharacterized protein n=1 Tax=Triticum turgidum subsp. durum TaxID=4567 RepID=A0A9R1QEC1_TRITD|nr:unnamed protein product [Triticum turgidum subsp. durum]